jgi:hypothetical protein
MSPAQENGRPSLMELALRSKSAMVVGIGGGGDVIQAIPVVNYLLLLGVKELVVGGVGCAWWTPQGEAISSEQGIYIYGPTIYDVEELTPCKKWGPGIVGVSPDSHWKGRRPAEAVLAHLLPDSPFVVSLLGGAQGVLESLRHVIRDRGIDLVVAVDIGSDAFHDGREASKAYTSLVDFISLAALAQLDVPVVYGLAGYGADGEMQLEELDERVGRVMKAGGYLGAMGLTQRDVEEMHQACLLYPDPVEPMAPAAARGELGLHNVMTKGPWGVVVKITPLAAVMLHFDPRVMIAEVCRGVAALKMTRSLAEAEEIYRSELGEIPETRLDKMIRFFHPSPPSSP